jgi:hypothetical protein
MYQCKIRYVGPEAHSLWTWASEFLTLEEAREYKRKRDGTPAGSFYPGWTCYVKIFQLVEVQ